MCALGLVGASLFPEPASLSDRKRVADSATAGDHGELDGSCCACHSLNAAVSGSVFCSGEALRSDAVATAVKCWHIALDKARTCVAEAVAIVNEGCC